MKLLKTKEEVILQISESKLQPPDINFSIDRNTGIYNEVWFGSKTLYFNGRCSLAKKKF
tara:strand:- start:14 stop:190 length:177 start_codon:yes stop_codon:yes gene_type:complete